MSCFLSLNIKKNMSFSTKINFTCSFATIGCQWKEFQRSKKYSGLGNSFSLRVVFLKEICFFYCIYLSVLGMVQKLFTFKEKCCGYKLSLPSFIFCGNDTVTIKIVSLKLPGLVRISSCFWSFWFPSMSFSYRLSDDMCCSSSELVSKIQFIKLRLTVAWLCN